MNGGKRDEFFEKLGMSKYQSAVLTALLLRNGSPMDYREIMNAAEVPYGRVHSTLADLEKRGLILSDNGRPKKYRCRSLGEIIENYALLPIINSTLFSPLTSDGKFRELWVNYMCNLVPVVRVEESGSASIEFLHGLEAIRESEFAEIEGARYNIKLMIPSSGFLDRKRPNYLRVLEEVKTEIISSLDPNDFFGRAPAEERLDLQKQIRKYGRVRNLVYYLKDDINMRMLLIDNYFATVGTPTLPVLLHIYSSDVCSKLNQLFEQNKMLATRVDIV